MKKVFGIVSALALLAGICSNGILASTPLFQGQYEITSVNGATNTGWRLIGVFDDASLLGWGASDCLSNDVIYCYSSYGDMDIYLITNVVSVVGAALTVDVVYNETGTPRAGAPQSGYQIMCRQGFDGVASFIPSLTFGQYTEYLQNGARNLALKYAIAVAATSGVQGATLAIGDHDGIITNGNILELTLSSSMTNFTKINSSTNWLSYDPATRSLIGCNTNNNVGTITNMTSADGSIVWGSPGGPQPSGSVTQYVASIASNKVSTNDPTYTNTVAKATAAYPSSNPSNFISSIGTISHTNLADVNGAADVQHLTAAQVGLVNGAVQPTDSDYTNTSALAAAAYPSSNPSNYVTASITNPLASTNWVLALNYYPSSNPSNYVDASVTNDLNAVVATKVPTNDPTYLAITTNKIALHNGTGIFWRVENNTNAYPDIAANQIFTSLQITGGATSSNQIWVTTNANGTGTLRTKILVMADFATGQRLTNTISTITNYVEKVDSTGEFNPTTGKFLVSRTAFLAVTFNAFWETGYGDESIFLCNNTTLLSSGARDIPRLSGIDSRLEGTFYVVATNGMILNLRGTSPKGSGFYLGYGSFIIAEFP